MDMTKEELLAAVRGVVQEELKAAKPVEVLTADEKVADKDTAGKFKSFGDFLSSIARMRSFGIPDNRLVYKTERGEIVKPAVNVDGKATLVEGTDSAGGYVN